MIWVIRDKRTETAMYAIVCTDNRLGMLFNHHRQSQDRILREYLLDLTEGHRLFMNEYSGKLFIKSDRIRISENFLLEAGNEDFCFVEDLPLLPALNQIDALILCKWNRDYPGDFFLDLDFSSWHLAYAEEFPGSSHDQITVEVYVK